MPESLYGAHPKKLPVRFKLPSHLDLLRFQHAKVKVGSTDHFSALKIWMFENKFVSLPSHLKTIEPMEVHRGQELCVIQKLQK